MRRVAIQLFRRISRSLSSRAGLAFVAAGLAAILLWMIGGFVWSVIEVAFIVVLLVATWWLARPDAKMLVGRGDHRPWLVRLREHRWRQIAVPFGPTLPRAIAYALLLLGWLWVFS